MGGSGSSPVLHGDLCILNSGPGQNGALVAVKKQTGEIVWRVSTPASAGEHSPAASRQPTGHVPAGAGRFLAWALFTGADTNQDEQITREEFSGLAKREFDTSDSNRSGTVDEDKLIQGLNRVVGTPPNVRS